MFMLLVMFKPQGLAGIWQDLIGRLGRSRRQTAAAVSTMTTR
jgi:hypothetical protein